MVLPVVKNPIFLGFVKSIDKNLSGFCAIYKNCLIYVKKNVHIYESLLINSNSKGNCIYLFMYV